MNKRRKLVKRLGMGAVWTTPVVQSIVLPSHAQTSDVTTTPTPTTTLPMCVDNVIERDNIPETPITWNRTMSVDQYDGPGTLSSVVVRVFASVRAEVGIENNDITAQTYTANLSASVNITGLAPLSVPIMDATTVNLEADDGTIDFSGPAGTSFTINTSEQMTTATFPPAGFVGTGKVDFPANASGTVTITGSSANTSQIRTFAQARIEVEYVC